MSLGYLREGGRGPIREGGIGLSVDFIPMMVATVGQIGSGKTNAELVLNSEFMASRGVVGLIFDFAGEILTGKSIGAGLAHHLSFHPPKICGFNRAKASYRPYSA